MKAISDDQFPDIRDAVRDLCAQFPDEYFRKVDEVRGTKRTSIPGNNVSNHRERVQRVE